MLEHDLQNLGFTEKESKVYLALNQYGAMPVSSIARVTGLRRSSVYNLLSSLQEKNVIGSYQKAHCTYFLIDDPRKIYLFEKEKLATAKNLVEQLQNQTKFEQNIKVNHYRGHEGYFEVYHEMLKLNPPEILCWVDINFLSVFNVEEEAKYLQERVNKGIPARIMMRECPSACKFKEDDARLNRETRLIGPEFTFDTTAFLYEGNIAMFDFHEPITAIRIQHPGLFRMFSEIFDMHWQGSGLDNAQKNARSG